METRSPQIHLDDNKARAGSTPHIVRYVLLASLALAIIALSAIWITGALTTPETGGTADTARAVAEDGGRMP